MKLPHGAVIAITFITFLFTDNVIHQMAPLFSEVDSNKFWPDVQNEEMTKLGKICSIFLKL